ncbi:hypothetical protein MMC16_004891 [Acarospora aff. strigata]|nr:hypothetical protein [Acarospora aff. strigata]
MEDLENPSGSLQAVSSVSPMPNQQRAEDPPTNLVILKIEQIFESFCDVILEDRQEGLAIPLVTAHQASKFNTLDLETGSIRSDPTVPAVDVCFPGKTPEEAWRFTVLVRILELIHEALTDNVITTKRDIYYKDPLLFGRQAVVDCYVDHIARTFGVQRRSMNVVWSLWRVGTAKRADMRAVPKAAAAKGFVVGCFQFERNDGSTVHGDSAKEGISVPDIMAIDCIRFHDVDWILVIEKEATFQSLAVNEFWKKSGAGNGILLTGKGYPDVSTRAFLRRLSVVTLLPGQARPSVFALVDFDPYGIAILSTYKHGSVTLAHENPYITVPSIHWLGPKSQDLFSEGESEEEQGLLRLTARDRRIAVKMLERPTFAEHKPERSWRRELQVMLMLNTKAEIQLMSGREGGLEKWLETKLLVELSVARSPQI